MAKVIQIKIFLNKRYQKQIRDLTIEIDKEIEKALKEGILYETSSIQTRS